VRTLLIAVLVSLIAVPAAFATTCIYDWEDCGTVIGMYPDMNAMIVTNVTAPDPVYEGMRSLKIEDNLASGTPQAFVAWVYGLADGDSVWAQFARYDNSPDASPSVRIWGHWNDTMDVTGYSGSAGGNGDYGLGLGWDVHGWGWMVVDGHTGLIIEARTYSNPGDIVWIDDLQVSFYTDHAGVCVMVPLAGPSAVEPSTWGGIKALFE
jgi:hypothetical protein